MTGVEFLIQKLNALIWSDVTLVLLLGTGLYFTVKLRFCQAAKLKRGFSVLFCGKKGSEAGVSQFQTAATTLAATMGTGNLVGVATAITIGGAGAIFWMWMSAFLGMALVYTENVLGAKYRRRDENGAWQGGPMAYLEHGVGSRPLALLFAFFCVLASLGMGNMVQTNAVAQSLSSLHIPAEITALVLAVGMAVILFGGMERIGKAAVCLIPPVSVCYLLGALIVLLLHADAIPAVCSEIFRGAFGLSAAGGGVAGAAVRSCINIGMRRGVFSNEAGLGSAPLLHSNAAEEDPDIQGACGIAEVFLDTIVCCTMTALVLLTTGAAQSGTDGALMLRAAFSESFGACGAWFVTAAIALYAVGTLIGWSGCGLCASRYLSPKWGESVYRLCFLACCFVGATTSLTTVWTLSDCLNGLMLLPNLIALLLLRNEVKCTS